VEDVDGFLIWYSRPGLSINDLIQPGHPFLMLPETDDSRTYVIIWRSSAAICRND